MWCYSRLKLSTLVEQLPEELVYDVNERMRLNRIVPLLVNWLNFKIP